jgi:hypothetical protein
MKAHAGVAENGDTGTVMMVVRFMLRIAQLGRQKRPGPRKVA